MFIPSAKSATAILSTLTTPQSYSELLWAAMSKTGKGYSKPSTKNTGEDERREKNKTENNKTLRMHRSNTSGKFCAWAAKSMQEVVRKNQEKRMKYGNK